MKSFDNDYQLNLEDIYYNESGSATKKMDYVKLHIDNFTKKVKVKYGNGLSSRSTGKSPLIKHLNHTLKGDSCDDVLATEY